MKLGSFISGTFGTLGFGLSVLAGIGADNSVESILTRALLSAGVCYVVGYFVGLMAQQVSLEHARHISKIVAEQDALTETKRLEDQAKNDAEAAGHAETAATVAGAIPGNR